MAPGSPWNQSTLGYAYGVTGQRTEALQAVASLSQLAKTRYIPPSAWVYVNLGLGQKEDVLDWLERACEERDGWIIGIIEEPYLAPLRTEPRFQALLKKMGLAR